MPAFIYYLQLGANSFALIVAGWIYLAYIRNLRAVMQAKDEQAKALERNLAFWKDKAIEFEKKTPEYIEGILAERIRLREEEIARLDLDRREHSKLIASKTKEVSRLREEIEKANYLHRSLTYYDVDTDEEIVIPESDLELEYLGEIFVDSASVLIADPIYVEHEWRKDIEFEDLRIYHHAETGAQYQYGVDFTHYDSIIPDLQASPNELISEGKLIPVEAEREFTFSYPGAAYASMSKNGYGELEFKNGNTGAGICVRTVYGDGGYQVYGERYRGQIYRVYIELQ